MTPEQSQSAIQEVSDFAESKGLQVRFFDPQKRALVIAWMEPSEGSADTPVRITEPAAPSTEASPASMDT